MANIGLFFGSDEGNTEKVAYRVQARLGADNVDVMDISNATQLDFAAYEHMILGISTWDFGQIQSDWEEFWGDLEEIDFSGKTVALYGLGDQFGYGDFFLDAMGMMHDVIVAAGGQMIGYWPTQGYEFDASKALTAEGHLFVGLGLDEDQQPGLSKQRLDQWCIQVHSEFALTTDILTVDD